MTDDEPHYHGHRQRLRERFLKSGLDGFADYEVVELLLTLAIPRSDVKQPAKGADRALRQPPRHPGRAARGASRRHGHRQSSRRLPCRSSRPLRRSTSSRAAKVATRSRIPPGSQSSGACASAPSRTRSSRWPISTRATGCCATAWRPSKKARSTAPPSIPAA